MISYLSYYWLYLYSDVKNKQTCLLILGFLIQSLSNIYKVITES